MNISKQRAMYRVIEQHLSKCIRWGEFDPAPSVLDAAIGALALIDGADTVYYEAINGDISFAAARIADVANMQLAEFGIEPAFKSETLPHLASRRERQLLHEYALFFLTQYEAYAWELWEDARREMPEPAEYDI